MWSERTIVLVTLAVMGAAVGVAFLRDGIAVVRGAVRRMAGHCAECGYDLTGLTGSRCPECGGRGGRFDGS